MIALKYNWEVKYLLLLLSNHLVVKSAPCCPCDARSLAHFMREDFWVAFIAFSCHIFSLIWDLCWMFYNMSMRRSHYGLQNIILSTRKAILNKYTSGNFTLI